MKSRKKLIYHISFFIAKIEIVDYYWTICKTRGTIDFNIKYYLVLSIDKRAASSFQVSLRLTKHNTVHMARRRLIRLQIE